MDTLDFNAKWSIVVDPYGIEYGRMTPWSPSRAKNINDISMRTNSDHGEKSARVLFYLYGKASFGYLKEKIENLHLE
jgi:hypothetical protein